MLALDGDGADVLVGGEKMAEEPAGAGFRIALEGEHPRLVARGQGDVEGVERRGEAFADRLQISFLARPAVEERLFLEVRRQRTQHLALALREEALRDLLTVGHRLAEFEVDADLPPL